MLHFREPEGVRFDHALFEGLRVPPYYDSMLGKLIAHASSRDEAIEQLGCALDRTELLGFPTNRRLLAACLRHPTFRAGQALIPFLDDNAAGLRAGLLSEEREVVIGLCLSAVFGGRSATETLYLPCPFPRPVRLRHRGEAMDLRVRELPQGLLEVDDGQALRVLTREAAVAKSIEQSRWHVQAGAVDLVVDDISFEPALPGSAAHGAGDLRAPFNGKVISVQAAPGARVARGDTLLVIESMKLEHALAASRDGVVKTVHVEAGQQAATAQVLVSFESSFEGAP